MAVLSSLGALTTVLISTLLSMLQGLLEGISGLDKTIKTDMIFQVFITCKVDAECRLRSITGNTFCSKDK